MQLRKIVKNRGHFPSDEAASKLLFLALRNIEKDWKMPPITWRQAVNQFAILFGERFACAVSRHFLTDLSTRNSRHLRELLSRFTALTEAVSSHQNSARLRPR
jgi:hypothetical protein